MRFDWNLEIINWKLITLWVIILFLALYRVFTAQFKYTDGQRVRITTIVRSEPNQYENAQGIRIAGLYAYLPKYPKINYADKIVVEGEVEGKKIKGPTLVYYERATGLLYLYRSKIIDLYQKTLPAEDAALVSGVALGSKAGIRESFWNNLKKSGTAHVVVASGFNVSLVSGFLFGALGSIPLAVAGTWIYTLFAGFEAPLIRAAIMSTLAFGALALGRPSTAWRILIFSGLAMIIINPNWINDIGFILSFTATLSLILFEAKISKATKFLPKIFAEGFSTSLAAQIGVAPIIYFTFGQFNILSPLVNALVLWTIAPITIIGMLSGAIGIIAPQVGSLILFVSYPLTSWFVWIINIFGNI